MYHPNIHLVSDQVVGKVALILILQMEREHEETNKMMISRFSQ